MQQSPSSSSKLSFYDSGYSSPSFHISSCPYSNQSFYISSPPSYPIYQPLISSTPVSLTQNSQSKHSRPLSPSFSSARKRISDEAIECLNIFYAKTKRPTDVEKDRLAIECSITLKQVNTWFNNARSRRGDTRTNLTQKLLKKQIDSLSNQIMVLQQSSSF